MNQDRKESEEYMIALSDLVLIMKKGRKKILFGALVFSILISVLVLMRIPKYEVRASFKEKGNADSGLPNSGITSLFLKGGNNKSEAVGLMKSHKLLSEVVKKLSLQATLREKGITYPRLSAVYDNLLVEYAYFKKKKTPPLSDPDPILRVENVFYDNEIPLDVSLTFTSNDFYKVIDLKGTVLGTGKINDQFSQPGFSFTILRNDERKLLGNKYILTLSSVTEITETLAQSITIEPDKEDQSLLMLTYSHPDRHLACQVLDTLMAEYGRYLKDEQNRVSNEQIAYLERRQNQMTVKLTDMLNEYANNLAHELSSLGFINSERAMEFIARVQQEYIQKLLKINLESKRIEQVVETGLNQSLALENEERVSMIDDLLKDIFQLKSQSDTLDLYLRGDYKDDVEARILISEQVANLTEIKQCKSEAESLLSECKKGFFPKPVDKLFAKPKYMAKIWYDQLAELAHDRQSDTYKQTRKQFETYLVNLIHFLDVQDKSINERLMHEQGPQTDFQGIDLDTAKQLYMTYTEQLNKTETAILKLEYVLEQMKSPDFEISSLSSVLEDPVSRNMVGDASQKILALRDEKNRGEREQSRFKRELDIAKGFLSLHVKQTTELQKLQEKLLREKIKSLQITTHELIQQQVSIIEKQITETLTSRLVSLGQERSLLEEQGKELIEQTSNLPKKWVSEKLIQTQLAMNQRMVEEITRLVESKNIANNLDMVQSAPLDHPVAPILPKKPKLFLFALLGALLGGFLTTTFLFVKTIMRGLHATRDNLHLAGLHVSGSLSKESDNEKDLSDQDLGTLRRLVSHIENGKENSLVLIQGNSVDYTKPLCCLLSKKGYSILNLSLLFDRTYNPEKLPGLLQVMENKVTEPKIIKNETHDTIVAGGVCRFANEFLSSEKFAKLLEKYKNEYDWVIATTNTYPSTAEAENLLLLFDQISVSITNETLSDLDPMIRSVKERKINASFVFLK